MNIKCNPSKYIVDIFNAWGINTGSLSLKRLNQTHPSSAAWRSAMSQFEQLRWLKQSEQ